MWHTGKRNRPMCFHALTWGFSRHRKVYTIKRHCCPWPSLSTIVWAPGILEDKSELLWNLFYGGKFVFELGQEHQPSLCPQYLMFEEILIAGCPLSDTREGESVYKVFCILSCPISYNSSLFLDLSFDWWRGRYAWVGVKVPEICLEQKQIWYMEDK